MRKAHKISKPTGQTRPTNCIFFDTETYDLKQKGNLIPSKMKLYTAVYYRPATSKRKAIEKWDEGRSPKRLYEFIQSHAYQGKQLYVFSANIWFDLRNSDLLQNALNDEWKIVKYFDRGHALLIKLKRDKASLTFVNIQGIIPYPVKRMGETLGLPKLEVDFETVKYKDLLTYCRRDTEIIYKMYLSWINFLDENNFGSFKSTLASQAFTAYTHRFMSNPIYVHDWKKVIDLEREAYMGGRTDTHFIGELKDTKIYTLDINSMYPFVMYEHDYPCKVLDYRVKVEPKDVYKWSKKWAIVAECDIRTNIPAYSKRMNHKLVFPVGRFETCLCTGSYRYAYEHGHIEWVNRVSVYKKAPLFRTWVNDLYERRQLYKAQGNYVYEQLIKLILNSFYGKFGQRGDELLEEIDMDSIDFFSESAYDDDIEAWVLKTHIGNLERTTAIMTEEGFNSFPAISAHVTDYARMYLWTLCEKAEWDNVYYTDTDSLFVNRKGYENLSSELDQTRLGKLKLESESTGIKIYGPKDYELGGKVCLKGVPNNAKPLGNNTFEYIMFPSIRSDLQGGMTENYCKRIVRKHLERKYDKGIVTSSGIVQPLRLNEF